jgi:hypothetical protein
MTVVGVLDDICGSGSIPAQIPAMLMNTAILNRS